MSDNGKVKAGITFSGLGFGVWWFIWGAKGFWWGGLYGLFWPVWVGYRLAAFLSGGGK